MIYHGTQAHIGQNIYFVAEWKIYYQPLIVQFNKEAYTNDQIILKNFNTNLVPSLNAVERQTIHGPTTAESIGQLLDSPPNPTLCNGPILPTPPERSSRTKNLWSLTLHKLHKLLKQRGNPFPKSPMHLARLRQATYGFAAWGWSIQTRCFMLIYTEDRIGMLQEFLSDSWLIMRNL